MKPIRTVIRTDLVVDEDDGWLSGEIHSKFSLESIKQRLVRVDPSSAGIGRKYILTRWTAVLRAAVQRMQSRLS